MTFTGLKTVVCPAGVVIADTELVLLNNVEMFSKLLFRILLIKYVFELEKLTQSYWELGFRG